MVVGGMSWTAMMGWVVAILLLNVPGKPPRVFMLDPIGMVGFMMTVYVCSLVLTGTGFGWSVALTRKYPELWSRMVVAPRGMVGVAMGLPLPGLAFNFVIRMS